jgi:membrane glycosyltransferase
MRDHAPPPPTRPLATGPLGLRRLALVLPTLALAGLVAALAARVAPAETALGAMVLVLFCALMAWHGFIAWQYVYGLVARVRDLVSPFERRARAVPAEPSTSSRTAAIVPIHAEDPVAVFAALRVMARSLAAGGPSRDIDLFVLSDTQDAAIAAAELRERDRYLAWAARDPALPRLRYRRRSDNAGRKAGNVAEFCAVHGSEYDFMIVLDADSLMTGPAMRRLVRLMEEHPETGLIQTVSYAAGRDTLFARVQQFAVRLYAPLALRALETWQGPDGSYWGHNAIVRIAPFLEHCRLPVLPGRAPLGGEILCHDVVEGALLRRAGYAVRLLPEMGGTWEEMPTNVVDLLGRERRWCQGNLQHGGVLRWPGLVAASRAHLLTGIAAYLTAPLWVAFVALGTLQAALTGRLGLLAYGLGDGTVGLTLAGLCLAIFAAPKLLSLASVLGDAGARRAYGGARRLLAGAVLEQALWVLLWPVLTLFNAGAVVATALGRVVRWDVQVRDDRRVPWREACRLQADALVAGAALTVGLVLAGQPWLALWMAPVALALLASPALSVLTSRDDLGRRATRAGLFLTEDDTARAPELAALAAARAAPQPVRSDAGLARAARDLALPEPAGSAGGG